MPAAKKHSSAITTTDGRKANGRKKGTKVAKKRRDPLLTPSKLNKAKKERTQLYSINAIIKAYGSQEAFFELLADKSKDNFNDRKLLLEYAYGKPEDNQGAANNRVAPQINFYSSTPPRIDNTVDIEHEDVED